MRLTLDESKLPDPMLDRIDAYNRAGHTPAPFVALQEGPSAIREVAAKMQVGVAALITFLQDLAPGLPQDHLFG